MSNRQNKRAPQSQAEGRGEEGGGAHFVLGTAGHIDHGKTALVKALTGIDADRLKEEKQRGITIELGFAHMESPGLTVSLVDVPGHERFVRAMASGATGMDAVMLIIAADEGVMPQTREHLAICNLLGMSEGFVAVTKSDLVDEEWLELVLDDLRESLQGTFLEGCDVFSCSAVTGQGVEAVREQIWALADRIQQRPDHGLTRLPMDRVFTMRGFGTVVTGTLVSGTLKVGDDLVSLPSGKTLKVRGLQVHGDSKESVTAGTRVAVNLKGADKEELSRGEVLVHPNTLKPTQRFDALVAHLGWNSAPLKRRKPFMVLSGTTVTEATSIPLSDKEIPPGVSAPAQIHTKAPVVLFPGDRFIIQGFGANPQHGATTGGGTVLRPHPRRRRKPDKDYAAWLERLAVSSPKERLLMEAERKAARGLSPEEAFTLVPALPNAVHGDYDELVAEEKLLEYDAESHRAVHPQAVETLEGRLLTELENLTQTSPLVGTYPRQELLSKMPKYLSPKLFAQVLSRLVERGEVVTDGENVALAKNPHAKRRDELGSKVAAHYKEHRLTPPKPNVVAEALSLSEPDIRDLVTGLVRQGTLVRARDDLFFHREVVDTLQHKLVKFLEDKGEIQPLEFKEMCGVTRRYLIPLAEMFDELQVTIRTGDVRRLRTS